MDDDRSIGEDHGDGDRQLDPEPEFARDLPGDREDAEHQDDHGEVVRDEFHELIGIDHDPVSGTDRINDVPTVGIDRRSPPLNERCPYLVGNEPVWERCDVDARAMNRLTPRVRLVWFLSGVLLAVILVGVATVGVLLLDLSEWTPIAVGLGVLLITGPLAVARYRRWGYEIREDSLYLERGVITEVRTVVPFVRIQHVDSRRSPLERATGLASTVVYTAGTRGSDVRIPGLTPTDAYELRDRLKRLAILAEGEDAV